MQSKGSVQPLTQEQDAAGILIDLIKYSTLGSLCLHPLHYRAASQSE